MYMFSLVRGVRVPVNEWFFRSLSFILHFVILYLLYLYLYILTHTSNAKCFRRIILINKRGLAEIIIPFRGYGRHSSRQVMIKRK